MSFLSIAGAVFSTELVKRLNEIGNVPEPVIDAVRTSVEAIFTLPPEMKAPVIRAYMSSITTVFIVGIPTSVLAAVAGLSVTRKKIDVGGMGSVGA